MCLEKLEEWCENAFENWSLIKWFAEYFYSTGREIKSDPMALTETVTENS